MAALPEAPRTLAELPRALEELSVHMRQVATAMQELVPLDFLYSRGLELDAAGVMAARWAEDIQRSLTDAYMRACKEHSRLAVLIATPEEYGLWPSSPSSR